MKHRLAQRTQLLAYGERQPKAAILKELSVPVFGSNTILVFFLLSQKMYSFLEDY